MNKSWRKRRRKARREQTSSMIGRIIDLPLEDFKKELVKQEVNVGTMNNLILNLEGAYNELRMRKEGVLTLVFENKLNKDDENTKNILNGLYAEMTKVEMKITYLKDKVKELVNVG